MLLWRAVAFLCLAFSTVKGLPAYTAIGVEDDELPAPSRELQDQRGAVGAALCDPLYNPGDTPLPPEIYTDPADPRRQGIALGTTMSCLPSLIHATTSFMIASTFFFMILARLVYSTTLLISPLLSSPRNYQYVEVPLIDQPLLAKSYAQYLVGAYDHIAHAYLFDHPIAK